MTGYGDVGEEVIGRLAGRLGCAPHQITLWQRGLTWHPAGLTQHIWAEEASRDSAVATWCVQMRTWCLKRVVASSHEMVSAIASELPHNTLSALVRKPGSPSRLGLGASMHMREDRVEWVSRFMAAVARLQVHDAVRLSRSPAVLAAGAAPDLATDRLSVDAQDTTTIPDATDPRILPPLPLETLPFGELVEALRAHDGVRAIATHSGITASFPWTVDGDAHDFMILEMRVGSRPSVGQGVWMSMAMPSATPAHLLHALALNEAEMGAGSPTDVTGGWIVRGATLLHESFVPWSLCSGEVLRHVADAASRRAAWLRLVGPSIVPAEWPSGVPGRVLPFRGRR
jgi:hypothetical protein